MAMKKKFLGLALAAAVALPATSAYAANSDTITGNQGDTLSREVTVTGNIRNKNGVAAEGKLEVELPTTMKFTVDQDGAFEGTTYNVTNRSESAIEVSLGSFSKTGDNIKLLPTSDESKMTSKKRNEVILALVGQEGHVDLSNPVAGTKLLEVAGGNKVGTIELAGLAGKEKMDENLETSGVSENFKLVFQIKKAEASAGAGQQAGGPAAR